MFEITNAHIKTDQRKVIELVKANSISQLPVFGSSEQMSMLEVEERLRRVDYHYYSFKKWESTKASDDAIKTYARGELNDCLKTHNAIKFYSAASLIRKNYQEWEIFISDPAKGAPAHLQSLTDNMQLTFCLAALEIQGFINLKPDRPFISGESVKGIVQLEAEHTAESAKKIVLLWDLLGRPQILFEDDRFMDMAFKAFFMNGGKYALDMGYTQYPGFVFGNILHVINHDYFVPIMEIPERIGGEISGYRFEFHFWELIDNASLTMAFDSVDFDTLRTIEDLFPEKPGLIPEIIHAYLCGSYEYRRVSVETRQRLKFRELLCEYFLGVGKVSWINWGDISSSLCTTSNHKYILHHRGALLQLPKFPEVERECKEQTYCYHCYSDCASKYSRNPEGL